MPFRSLTTSVLLALTLAPRASATPLRVVCLGDSLTEGYGVAKEEAWPSVAEAMLKGEGYDVSLVNAGVSGSTTASGEKRLAWLLKAKIKPDLVVVELGANDGLRGVALDAIKHNLETVVRLAKTSGLTVLVAGMQMPPNYGKDYVPGFAAIYPAVAKAEGVTLLPFLLDGVAGDRALNQADGIHPNATGHKIVAATVASALRPLLASAKGAAPPSASTAAPASPKP